MEEDTQEQIHAHILLLPAILYAWRVCVDDESNGAGPQDMVGRGLVD